jgi:hypothetical protein
MELSAGVLGLFRLRVSSRESNARGQFKFWRKLARHTLHLVCALTLPMPGELRYFPIDAKLKC